MCCHIITVTLKALLSIVREKSADYDWFWISYLQRQNIIRHCPVITGSIDLISTNIIVIILLYYILVTLFWWITLCRHLNNTCVLTFFFFNLIPDKSPLCWYYNLQTKRCSLGLSSGHCAGQSSSSMPTLDITLCTETLS